jgi:perosamine synthetase
MKVFQNFKPIFTSLSPNTEKDDILLAFQLIFKPQKWTKGKAVKKLEEEFQKYLRAKYVFAFNSGRSALLAILEALKISKGEEVLLQSFTCNSAINPILERGAKPVFVDIDNTLNLDPNDLKKKITPRSKAVMVQHTFGWPAQIEEILRITKERNLFLIEDCAHALGAKYRGKFCGTFGNASFFSLGRDKIISSVFGGMAITNEEKIAQKIRDFQERLNYPSNFWIFQQLLHPILTNYLVVPLYGLDKTLGKILLGIFHKTRILSKAVYIEEKHGKLSKCFPKRLANTLAILALNQLRKLERFNNHRRKIADFYQSELKNTDFVLPLARKDTERKPTFMRYSILTDFDTDKILGQARKRKIYLDDGWRKSPIVPPDTNLEKMGYILGTCPKAERVAKTIINLPTHINISKKEAKKIVDFYKDVCKLKR